MRNNLFSDLKELSPDAILNFSLLKAIFLFTRDHEY
jgi:hypothetical protein